MSTSLVVLLLLLLWSFKNSLYRAGIKSHMCTEAIVADDIASLHPPGPSNV